VMPAPDDQTKPKDKLEELRDGYVSQKPEISVVSTAAEDKKPDVGGTVQPGVAPTARVDSLDDLEKLEADKTNIQKTRPKVMTVEQLQQMVNSCAGGKAKQRKWIGTGGTMKQGSKGSLNPPIGATMGTMGTMGSTMMSRQSSQNLGGSASPQKMSLQKQGSGVGSAARSSSPPPRAPSPPPRAPSNLPRSSSPERKPPPSPQKSSIASKAPQAQAHASRSTLAKAGASQMAK